MKTLEDLTVNFLQDMYYAERQILKALPKMAKLVQSEKLKEGLLQHREETEHHVERLQEVFEQLGKRARGRTCEAINGIIEEGDEAAEEFERGPILDAAIAGNAQAVEHYEMARYGTLIAWLKAAGKTEAVGLLNSTLDEEKKADALLSHIANSELNKRAEHHEQHARA